jgi:tetratricopeptide (TPR) repeat protein
LNALKEASRLLPNHAGYRINLGLVAALTGEFQIATDVTRELSNQDPRVLQIIAYSQVGLGMLPQAKDTYAKMSGLGPRGASSAAQGLGDLAVYEGRFSDAVIEFERGVATDLTANNRDRAAVQFTSMAYAHVFAGRNAEAIVAAEKALELDTGTLTRFMAARVFAEAGAIAMAKPLADRLSQELTAEAQAHGKILEGLIALKEGEAREAIRLLTDANTQLDTWFGHYDLGRAYLEAGAPLQAQAELDRCITRRSEALSLTIEGPTYGHFPLVYYYQGRAREAAGDTAFADSYNKYLEIRGGSTEDELVRDVRQRAG